MCVETRGRKKEEGPKVYAFGYLIKGQSFRLIEERTLPEYHLHLAFSADYSTDRGVLATAMVIDALLEIGDEIGRKCAQKRVLLRFWCKSTERSQMSFLKAFGFTPYDKMFVMEKTLRQAGKGRTDSAESSRRENANGERVNGVNMSSAPASVYDLSKPSNMKEYLLGTEEAFDIPDSEDEMIYCMSHRKGMVYTNAGYAFVTVYPVTAEKAATENVFTRKAFRRQGLMENLLLNVHEILAGQGYKKATLNVYEKDTDAIRLYEKTGYKKKHTLIELCVETGIRI